MEHEIDKVPAQISENNLDNNVKWIPLAQRNIVGLSDRSAYRLD